MYKTSTWLRVWSVLQLYPFRFWWFDVLPWKCIVGGAKSAVVDEQWVIHKGSAKTLKIKMKQTLVEKKMRNEIIEKFGCCQVLRSLPQGSPRPTLQKCRCTRGGLYC